MLLKGVSESFRNRADSAAFWEAWVGAVLARAGLYTLHHPFEIDGKDHGHSFDLTVSAYPSMRMPYEVEVKSVNREFSVPSDFNDGMILVCSQNSWLRKWPGHDTTQRIFLFVSRISGSVVYLPIGSPVVLGGEITDRTRGELYKVVRSDKDNLRPLQDFVELVKESSEQETARICQNYRHLQWKDSRRGTRISVRGLD